MRSCWKKVFQTTREVLLRRFVDIQYERSEDLRRGTFRVRGDIWKFTRLTKDQAYRMRCGATRSDKLRQIDPLTGEVRPGQGYFPRADLSEDSLRHAAGQRESAPSSLFRRSSGGGKKNWRSREFVEAQRLQQRTLFDIEMMRTIGYCHGIEIISRHLSGRLPEKRRPRCSIIFRKTICCSSTNLIRPFPQVRECITATARAGNAG